MIVSIYVSASKAVLDGKTKSGIQHLRLSEADLQSLSDEERAELVCYKGLGQEATSWNDCLNPGNEPEVGSASIEALCEILAASKTKRADEEQEKAARRKEKKTETLAVLRERKVRDRHSSAQMPDIGLVQYRSIEAAWSYFDLDAEVCNSEEAQRWEKDISVENDRRLKTAITDKVAKQAEEKREEAKIDKRKEEAESILCEAIAAFIGQHGDEAAKGRLKDNLLGRNDALDLIRQHLFASLDNVTVTTAGHESETYSLPRYNRLRVSDIEHNVDCSDGSTGSWSTHEAESLSAHEWLELQTIRKVVPEGATVEPKMHAGVCDACDGTARRLGVLVTINWHGRKLSREYACDPQPPKR